MNPSARGAALAVAACLTLFVPAPGRAQLDKTFERMFNRFLFEDLVSNVPALGNAFDNAAVRANSQLKPALNQMISSNVAAFPLPATNAAPTYMFDENFIPVRTGGSQGPIFAESAHTVGKGKVAFGAFLAHYPLSRFRGMALQEMRFTLFSDEILPDNITGGPGFGRFETDMIDIYPDLHLTANSLTLFASWGVTGALDLAVAVPFIQLRMRGTARAVIISNSFFFTGIAFTNFNNDQLNPLLEDTFAYDKQAFGPGDMALRLKYSFLRHTDMHATPVDMAALLDVRLPTGDKSNFIGVGSSSVKFAWIISKTLGNFAPHFNLAFDSHGARFESNELDISLGFDHSLSDQLTFIFDFTGDYDLTPGKTQLFPGRRKLVFSQEFNNLPSTFERVFTESNVPAFQRDHIANIAAGLKISPTPRSLLLFNVLLPLQTGGLRSNFIPGFGAALVF